MGGFFARFLVFARLGRFIAPKQAARRRRVDSKREWNEKRGIEWLEAQIQGSVKCGAQLCAAAWAAAGPDELKPRVTSALSRWWWREDGAHASSCAALLVPGRFDGHQALQPGVGRWRRTKEGEEFFKAVGVQRDEGLVKQHGLRALARGLKHEVGAGFAKRACGTVNDGALRGQGADVDGGVTHDGRLAGLMDGGLSCAV